MSPSKQFHDHETKTPSPNPYWDERDVLHQHEPRLPIARETSRSKLETPTMLAATPSTPISPGCEPQTDVVEPLENRVVTTPRQCQRRYRGGRSRGMRVENSATNAPQRSNGHPPRIYRQHRQLPRTNSGRQLRGYEQDVIAERNERACRDSRTVNEVAAPLILAVEDTPTPTTTQPRYLDHARRGSGSSELVRVPSNNSADSSLHTSVSDETESTMRLYIRDNSTRGTVVLEKEMTVHSLKMKVATVYEINQNEFELYHPRLGTKLRCDGPLGRVKLEDTDLVMDDEIVIIPAEDPFNQPRAGGGGGGHGRSAFQRTEQRRRSMTRKQRAKTSPNVVVPRSREPPSFEIQPHESPMGNFSPPRVLPSQNVNEMRQERALRRQRLHEKANVGSLSVPLHEGGTENEPGRHSGEGMNNRNRPVSIRSRESIPAIAVPGQTRTRSHPNLRTGVRHEIVVGEQDSMLPPLPDNPPRLHKRKSNTRVRLSNPMVIRRPRRQSESGSDGTAALPLSELDWSNNHQLGSETFLAARDTVSSAQQLVTTHHVQNDFASVMNFVDGPVDSRNTNPRSVGGQAPGYQYGEMPGYRRSRARRVRVNQPQKIPIRIESNPQLVRSVSSRQSPRNSRRNAAVAEDAPRSASSNQALFFFSDEQEPQQRFQVVPRREFVQERMPPPPVPARSRSAIGSYNPRPRTGARLVVPASPLETHSASPRDDEMLARQLAQQMDAEQQEQSSRLARQMQYWDADDEKYLRPESPVMFEPRRGFVVTDVENSPNHMNAIFERFGVLSPDNERFESATYEELLSLDDAIPKSGLTEREIWRLPLRALETAEQAERAGKCSVCQEEYAVGDELRRLPCMHEYHRHCIDKWLERSKKCPVDMNVVRV